MGRILGRMLGMPKYGHPALAFGLTMAVMVVYFSFFIVKYSGSGYLESNEGYIRISSVASSLTSYETSNGIKYGGMKKFAIGYNGNVDLVINAEDFFSSLDFECKEGEPRSDISNVDDLTSCFTYYFSQGAAAERFVKTDFLWNLIMKAVWRVDSNKRKAGLGGNAALMAQRLAEDGHSVLLGVHAGPDQTSHLHPSISLPGQTAHERNNTDHDNYHIILEYKSGSKICSKTSPRANRFIVSRNLDGARTSSLELFHDEIPKFGPDIVSISGLHLMTGQDLDSRTARLNDVVAELEELQEVPIHLELAGMPTEFMKELVYTVFPVVDSIGMNEQELLAVADSFRPKTCECDERTGEAIKGDPVECMCAKRKDFAVHPEVGKVLSLLKSIFSLCRQLSHRKKVLSRIHFHTVSFHVILEHGWKYGDAAVASSSLRATTQACGRSIFGLSYWISQVYNLISRVNSNTSSVIELGADNFVYVDEVRVLLGEPEYWPGVSSKQELMKIGGKELAVNISVAPVLNCLIPRNTVGLGDAISASGLVVDEKQ